MLNNGKLVRTGAGSIVFNGSNEPHSLRNIGSTPATYRVINWQGASGAAR